MRIIVQKFGGTSLATLELRKRVCDIIAATKKDDIGVVVVVSAMGRTGDVYATDTFINMVKEINPSPSPRELDLIMACGEIISGVLLASQLSFRGIKARFFTGQQAGIVTDSNHGNAHILYVNPKNIINCLKEGIVPVVAGFQGVDEKGEITTLGRGGSDTTAAALGVALNAEVIDIFTDVEGVMTADPRIVKDAKLLNVVTYNEICQLAREGAKVIHPRAVEIAMQKSIPLRVRSTFSDHTGTLVANVMTGTLDTVKLISDNLITGVTYTSNISQFKIDISTVQDKKGYELKIFKSLALAGISVDFINIQPEVILFTVGMENTRKAIEVLENIGIHPEVELDCAKVAVVGAAMTGIPGVMAKVVEALSENDIPILQSGDSYTNIWCLVKREHMETAVKALHDKFELGK
ncbi:aspartate kinase [Thermosyntropha lipolytica DSM 11003]|uniref:Aspartokinase n=1 Tax=Thermosyntropha lipolytica DSM 11003 TaxID=1123382 RepID=A0A1M5PWK1_9FIRM|nr:aspartate kinase [Thermosyntropha lipolytica]SHH06066.1 aspartate kinase [Thermosyntropha lipolytica DSM 11003]